MAQAFVDQQISTCSASDLWDFKGLSPYDKLYEYGRRMGVVVQRQSIDVDLCQGGPRVREVNEERVEEFKEALLLDKEDTLRKFASSSYIVYYIDGIFYITDGNHRFRAIIKYNATATEKIRTLDAVVFIDYKLCPVDILYTASVAEQNAQVKLVMSKPEVMKAVRILVKNSKFKLPIVKTLSRWTPEHLLPYQKIIGCPEANISAWMVLIAAHENISDEDFELIVSKAQLLGYEKNVWSSFIANWKKFGNNCREILRSIHSPVVGNEAKKALLKQIKGVRDKTMDSGVVNPHEVQENHVEDAREQDNYSDFVNGNKAQDNHIEDDRDEYHFSEPTNSYEAQETYAEDLTPAFLPRHGLELIGQTYAALLEHEQPAIAALVHFLKTKLFGSDGPVTIEDVQMLEYLDTEGGFDFDKLPRADTLDVEPVPNNFIVYEENLDAVPVEVNLLEASDVLGADLVDDLMFADETSHLNNSDDIFLTYTADGRLVNFLDPHSDTSVYDEIVRSEIDSLEKDSNPGIDNLGTEISVKNNDQLNDGLIEEPSVEAITQGAVENSQSEIRHEEIDESQGQPLRGDDVAQIEEQTAYGDSSMFAAQIMEQDAMVLRDEPIEYTHRKRTLSETKEKEHAVDERYRRSRSVSFFGITFDNPFLLSEDSADEIDDVPRKRKSTESESNGKKKRRTC